MATSQRYQGPRDAAETARNLSDGEVWALFHVDRARYSPAARSIRMFDGVGHFLDWAGLDAATDIDRFFVAAPYEASLDSIQVFEHSLSEANVDAAFDALVEEGHQAERMDAFGFPGAQISLGGLRRFVAAPERGLIVVLPEHQMLDAPEFLGSGGLPKPRHDEACELYAADPSRTLSFFTFPLSLRTARLTAWTKPLGKTRVLFQAWSETPEQAQRDATVLTNRTNDATGIDLWLVKWRVLGPFLFQAHDRLVSCDFRLAHEELEWLTAMALKSTPGG